MSSPLGSQALTQAAIIAVIDGEHSMNRKKLEALMIAALICCARATVAVAADTDPRAPELQAIDLAEVKAGAAAIAIQEPRAVPGALSSPHSPKGLGSVSFVQVPIGESNGVDNSWLVLGTLAGMKQGPLYAEEWDLDANAPVHKGQRLKIEPLNTNSYGGADSASSDQPEGNFIVGVTGSDMGINRGTPPLALELGAKASRGYLIVTGAIAPIKGFGGGFNVSPLAGLDYPLKPLIGYRYYRTSSIGYVNDNDDPDEIRSSHGPSVGLLAPMNAKIDLMIQMVKAQRTTTFHQYYGGKQIGEPQKTRGWSFVGGIIYNVGLND